MYKIFSKGSPTGYVASQLIPQNGRWRPAYGPYLSRKTWSGRLIYISPNMWSDPTYKFVHKPS